MSLVVGETAFSKALAYVAQVVGGFAVQVSASATVSIYFGLINRVFAITG